MFKVKYKFINQYLDGVYNDRIEAEKAAVEFINLYNIAVNQCHHNWYLCFLTVDDLLIEYRGE